MLQLQGNNIAVGKRLTTKAVKKKRKKQAGFVRSKKINLMILRD